MHIADSPFSLPLPPRALARGCTVTIGNFDGVHLGHQALIRQTVEKAQAQSQPSVIITFNPHPLQVIHGKDAPPQLISLQHKLECFADLGVDLALVLPFTEEISRLSPEDFVSNILVGALNTKALVVGYDYSFGKNRRGNAALLQSEGEKFGFSVESVPAFLLHGDVVSSTRIRTTLHNGLVKDAAELLGRPHSVDGTIIHGMNRGGRLLGFPTANLRLNEDLLLPKPGVYAVLAELNPATHTLPGICRGSGNTYLQGVANVGSNPTFGDKGLRVETHLLDFHSNIYDSSFRVHFIERLRDEKKFDSVVDLIEQIKNDSRSAKELLTLYTT